MTRRVLIALDLSPRAAANAVDLFRGKDEELLLRQQASAPDEATIRENVTRYSEELEQLFAADADSAEVEPESKGARRKVPA